MLRGQTKDRQVLILPGMAEYYVLTISLYIRLLSFLQHSTHTHTHTSRGPEAHRPDDSVCGLNRTVGNRELLLTV